MSRDSDESWRDALDDTEPDWEADLIRLRQTDGPQNEALALEMERLAQGAVRRSKLAWQIVTEPPPFQEMFSYGDFFGENNPVVMRDLEMVVTSGEITMRWEQMPKAPREWWPRIVNLFSGRTTSHKILCARAAMWLAHRGLKPVPDGHYPGGIADVSSIEGTPETVVECGYTQARKVLVACASGIDILVVPYLCGRPAGAHFQPRDRTRIQFLSDTLEKTAATDVKIEFPILSRYGRWRATLFDNNSTDILP